LKADYVGVGIDLELADVAAARHQLETCQKAGGLCPHEPDCEAHLYRLLSRGPAAFPYRRFSDINANMQMTGMGYAAEATPWHGADPDDVLRRSRTTPGRTGIPAYKLLTHDRWLITTREIDEALEAYAKAPPRQRARLEADPKWVSWIEWLTLARHRGGFAVE
jgi:hypothetical protein